MAVYIIHLNQPLKHARHYVGFANDVQGRFAHHQNGTGARLLQVCNQLGISYQLARVFDKADRTFERHLHNTKNTARYCPLCSADPRNYHPREAQHAE